MAAKNSGYALFLVMILITFLSILTASFSMNLSLGGRQAQSIQAASKALSAADAGIQYALEAVRQNKSIGTSETSEWKLLETSQGGSICFKVFSDPSCGINLICVKSYGEVVRGECGNYRQDQERILSAKKLSAEIKTLLNNEVLVKWEEETQP